MTTNKITEIALLFKNNPDLTSEEVENGYIFGAYGTNEHYKRETIEEIKKAVLDKLPHEEEIVEIQPTENEDKPDLETIISNII